MAQRWYALLLVLVLSLSWQSVLTHTHQHSASPAPSLLVAGSGAAALDVAPSDGKSAPDQPANCPACREIAHAGHYLLPTPVAFAAPAAPRFHVVAEAPFVSLEPARSHAWQSRAPPILLQA